MSIMLVNSNAERIPLADGVVHAVVTSPPYYGLRKYAVDEDDPEIGLEDTPELYLERMVAVFREVRRVLRPDGICWINLGDSYFSNDSRAGIYDTSGKAPASYQDHDLISENLCDVCRVAYQNHKSHNDNLLGSMLIASPYVSTHDHMESQSDHLPTLDSIPQAVHIAHATQDQERVVAIVVAFLRAARVSTNHEFYQQLRDACLQRVYSSLCLLCARSLVDGVHQFAHKISSPFVPHSSSDNIHRLNDIQRCNPNTSLIDDALDFHTEGMDADFYSYQYYTIKPHQYKALDLMSMPHRLLHALQADGWYHRSTIIWSKPNPMPESVSGWRWERHRVKVAPSLRYNSGRGEYNTLPAGNNHGEFLNHKPEALAQYTDCPGCEKCEPHGGLVLRRGSWRPTTAHEYIFMLTKTAGYWADGEAVREAHALGSIERARNPNFCTARQIGNDNNASNMNFYLQEHGIHLNPAGRNARTVWAIDSEIEFIKHCEAHGVDFMALMRSFVEGQDEKRTVWDFPTQPWSGAHFATYPEELPRRCLKASISERGCCPKCGAQWARVVESDRSYESGWAKAGNPGGRGKWGEKVQGGGVTSDIRMGPTIRSTTLGWLPTCDCGIDDTAPPIVLDPFAGSGTTGIVARELGAHFIGLDLSYAYLHEQARERLGLTALDAWSKGMPIEGTDAEEYQHKNMTVPGRQPHSFHVARVKDKNGKVITDLPLFQEVE